VEVPPDKVTEAWENVAHDYARYGRKSPDTAREGTAQCDREPVKKQIREEVEKKLLSRAAARRSTEKKLRVLSLADVQDVEIGRRQDDALHSHARDRHRSLSCRNTRASPSSCLRGCHPMTTWRSARESAGSVCGFHGREPTRRCGQ